MVRDGLPIHAQLKTASEPRSTSRDCGSEVIRGPTAMGREEEMGSGGLGALERLLSLFSFSPAPAGRREALGWPPLFQSSDEVWEQTPEVRMRSPFSRLNFSQAHRVGSTSHRMNALRPISALVYLSASSFLSLSCLAAESRGNLLLQNPGLWDHDLK